jgi:hypothetical protein rflaF_16875|nr:MAG TPA: tail protein [Caudoviricetes sp.]
MDGDILELSQNDKFKVLKVEGLNPPPANVNLTTLAGMHGSKLNIATIPQRNLVLYIKVESPVEANRNLLYRYFKVGGENTIYFKNGIRDVYIEGTVETIECPLFENNQTMQVSILCPQPFFKAMAYFVAEISKIMALFEFPFSIPAEGIEFSQFDLYKVTEINNTGDVDTGIIIRLQATGTVENPCIWNSSTREFFDISYTMKTGDVIEISTVRGDRYMHLYKIGETNYVNIINSRVEDSTWLMLRPGLNSFTYTTDTGDDNISISFIGNNMYGGV